MFSKILVANRGEIACRIIRTVQRMGISSVAVYSDADQEALHVEMADEAVHIGAAEASKSYLLGDKIIEICRDRGVEAVHPGYGFLSENAAFCDALEAAGIVFIGPKAPAIEAMGDKIASKKIAAKAGVSTVPGHIGIIEDGEEAVKIAQQIGFPVMLKASAGGGGKGMRIADNEEQVRQGFERCRSEALSSFGDQRIFIEKFITTPRHIEIQVLADGHGNYLSLGERECSIQRRNQKIIEEAPSPFLDTVLRNKMEEQALALARSVDYQSAGTVEFIVDQERNFYFLEMNTRLQVEHPVTELVTGIDLVEQMIRIAAGEKLTFDQSDIRRNGWAIESRLYAENPYMNFMPSSGRLRRYRPPTAEGLGKNITLRNDTGVREGDHVPIYYDPMLAKLCIHAPSRDLASDAMSDMLERFEIEGIAHNLPLLSSLMRHPRWRQGDLSTSLLDEEYPAGFDGPPVTENDLDPFAIAAVILAKIEAVRRSKLLNGEFTLRQGHAGEGARIVQIVASEDNRREIPVFIEKIDGQYRVTLDDGKAVRVSTDWSPDQSLASLDLDGERRVMKISPIIAGYRIRHRGYDLQCRVYTPRQAELAASLPVKSQSGMSASLLCPMPGLVVSLLVKVGERVEAGQTLAVIEAMKMENALVAAQPGTVAAVCVKVGDSLAADEIILEFEE